MIASLSNSTNAEIFIFDMKAKFYCAKSYSPVSEDDFYIFTDNITMLQESNELFGGNEPVDKFESFISLDNGQHIYLKSLDEGVCFVVNFNRLYNENPAMLKHNLQVLKDFLRPKA